MFTTMKREKRILKVIEDRELIEMNQTSITIKLIKQIMMAERTLIVTSRNNHETHLLMRRVISRILMQMMTWANLKLGGVTNLLLRHFLKVLIVRMINSRSNDICVHIFLFAIKITSRMRLSIAILTRMTIVCTKTRKQFRQVATIVNNVVML